MCEAAIDAISLYELHRIEGKEIGRWYISIGGAGKQGSIDWLKDKFKKAKFILAVDSDEAGESCRNRNPDLQSIIPSNKDWNEDLMIIKGIQR